MANSSNLSQVAAMANSYRFARECVHPLAAAAMVVADRPGYFG